MARFRKNDFFKWAQKIKSVFCFNPHTHEGCDPCLCPDSQYRRCFNPHTHEGCDSILISFAPSSGSFNPHTHEGCDLFATPPTALFNAVSIHTPTKGVTVATSQYSIMACFNPHTHEGCDSIVAWSLLVLMVFQSTHPRRV